MLPTIILLMPARQSRNWCFTLNNYTNDEYERLLQSYSPDAISYLVAGKEVGETGTPHLQGYVMFMRKKAAGGVKTALGTDRLHVEIARGTPIQAADYCKKDGDFIELGILQSTQGSRNDLSEVHEMLRTGSNMLEVADSHFSTFIKYHKGFTLYTSLRSTPRDFRTQCVWFWGPTGTGKSRRAYDESMALCNGSVSYISDETLRWFDPYRGEKGVVLEDFDGTAKISLLLRILDRYPLQVPVKGSFVQWRPRIVWITANFHPETLYGCSPQFAALLRRIDDIQYIDL